MTHSKIPQPVPALWKALVPVVYLILSLWMSVQRYKALELSTHVPLITATVVAAIMAGVVGLSWKRIEKGLVGGITLALQAILILLVIGMLIGTWIQAGIVPSMIYYGLKLISPSFFLVATTLICGVVSLATGSSWSTAATVGIALMGVGAGLGIPKPMIAGAVISGAYFGDKMSPLSDTTNLAPAVAGSRLFEHVRHMVYTTGPSLLIALALYAVLDHSHSGTLDASRVRGILDGLRAGFVIHPALLLPPLLIVALVIAKVPALPSLFGSWLLGAILAGTVQGKSLGQVLAATYSGVQAHTPNAMVNDLVSRGGIESMLSTVALIICALAFGGVMEEAGFLASIANGVLRLARGTGGLIAATLGTCIGMNILASDQYLAIVVPGRMYRSAYERQGLAPVNLSRALEDGGTLTSSLVPWNSGGAFMIATLGVAPWVYVPYAFLNIINPLVSAFYGFTGITIRPLQVSPDLARVDQDDVSDNDHEEKRLGQPPDE